MLEKYLLEVALSALYPPLAKYVLSRSHALKCSKNNVVVLNFSLVTTVLKALQFLNTFVLKCLQEPLILLPSYFCYLFQRMVDFQVSLHLLILEFVKVPSGFLRNSNLPGSLFLRTRHRLGDSLLLSSSSQYIIKESCFEFLTRFLYSSWELLKFNLEVFILIAFTHMIQEGSGWLPEFSLFSVISGNCFAAFAPSNGASFFETLQKCAIQSFQLSVYRQWSPWSPRKLHFIPKKIIERYPGFNLCITVCLHAIVRLNSK